jgi:hypothetical protein
VVAQIGQTVGYESQGRISGIERLSVRRSPFQASNADTGRQSKPLSVKSEATSGSCDLILFVQAVAETNDLGTS